MNDKSSPPSASSSSTNLYGRGRALRSRVVDTAAANSSNSHSDSSSDSSDDENDKDSNDNNEGIDDTPARSPAKKRQRLESPAPVTNRRPASQVLDGSKDGRLEPHHADNDNAAGLFNVFTTF